MIKLKFALLGIVFIVISSMLFVGYVVFQNNDTIYSLTQQVDTHQTRTTRLLSLMVDLTKYVNNATISNLKPIKDGVDSLHKQQPVSPSIRKMLEDLASNVEALSAAKSNNREALGKNIELISRQIMEETHREIKTVNTTIKERQKYIINALWLVLGVTMVVVVGYILGVIYNIIYPLKGIINDIQKIKSGNFEVATTTSRKGIFYEINTLRELVDQMACKLKESFSHIERSTHLIQEILDTAPVRIFWKDREGYYGGANRLFLGDAGMETSEQILGKKDSELPWKGEVGDQYRADDVRVMESEKAELQFEEPQLSADGKYKWLVTSKVPMRDDTGRVVGILGVYDDITEKRNIELELKEKNKIMIAQSRHAAMGEMISMLAHQWRQPLSVISMYANNLILDVEFGTLDNNSIIEVASKINDHTQKLSATIEHFHKFFKPNQKPEVIDIDEILEEIEHLIGRLLKEADIEFMIQNSVKVPIETYVGELLQVLVNLITNAKEALVKKTGMEEKRVTLCITETQKEIEWMLCDNGGGIDETIFKYIFDPYFTTKETKNEAGLGLYMAKTIIEQHLQGSLHVENKDKGVCACIKLPKVIEKNQEEM